jgi:hypothetical protein
MSHAISRRTSDERALNAERELLNKALADLDHVERVIAKKRERGRVVFALDLTASRERTLDQARIATAAMFNAIKAVGEVALKFVYYRGTNECKASSWHSDPEALCQSMLRLTCESGRTQIARVLGMVLAEKQRLSAVVFVGDQCEEDSARLETLAKALGEKAIPIFVFHECADDNDRSLSAKPIFKLLARASGGLYLELKADSGAALRETLSTVAAFSAGGVEGLGQMALPASSEVRKLRQSLMLTSGSKSIRRR